VIQRADETKEAVCNRLETYNQKTAPLIDFYQKEGLLKNFLSLQLPGTIAAIKKELNSLNKH
jgi:adenylate kinase